MSKTVTLGKARVPEGTRIYAIGDVHGHLDLMIELLEKIKLDLTTFPITKHKIIFLGDYIDRGPDSASCIEKLIEVQKLNPNTIFLTGNHEEKLLKFLDYPEDFASSFFGYGGVECCASYGIKTENYHNNTVEIAVKLKSKMPKSHLSFMKGLLDHFVIGDYFFVHAGIRPDIPLNEQSHQDLLTIRTDFIFHSEPYEKVVVHGHTPQPEPEALENRINVDTCAYDTGVLTSVVLEANNYRFIDTS